MVTIGFNKLTYSVLEDAGSVNVTVSILNENLARNVVVILSTELGGTATGKFYKNTIILLPDENMFPISYHSSWDRLH